MRAAEKDSIVAQRIARKLGIQVTIAHANTLRRAEMALARWAEAECGDGSNWHIERDEITGKPYSHYHGEGAHIRPRPIPSRSA